MASRTYYEILGVPPSADAEVVEKAYRRGVRHVHPDVNDEPDALERFYTLQRAYEVIRDPDRRRRYDHQLAAKAKPSPRTSNEILQRRAAARAAASAAPGGASSAAGAVAAMAYGGRPMWDPLNNPVLRKKMERARRKRWFARFEMGVMLFNLALAAFGVYQGYVLVQTLEASRAAAVNDPGVPVDPADADGSPSRDPRWADQIIQTIEGIGVRAEPSIGPWPDDAKVERLGPDDDWQRPQPPEPAATPRKDPVQPDDPPDTLPPPVIDL